MTENTVRFIKTPLSDSINWQDLPPELKGRVILKRWSANERTAGGLVIPEQASRRVMGVAWVVRAMGDAQKYLAPGDTVICPETTINAGLRFPSDDGELSDCREIAAEDCYHVLPYAKALEWFTAEAAKFEAEAETGIPDCLLLAQEGQCQTALAMQQRLVSKEDYLTPLTVEKVKALGDEVLRLTQEHARRKSAEKEAADIAAKLSLKAERERLVKGN